MRSPIFITSASGERSSWDGIYKALPATYRTFFLPERGGEHGSAALWGSTQGNGDYWKVVEVFLKPLTR